MDIDIPRYSINLKDKYEKIPKQGVVSISSLKAYKDPFPEVTMAIFLKETSFCRGDYESGLAPSLCSSRWQEDMRFNPNNPFGMNHPLTRKTTSKGKLRDFMPEYIPETLKEYRVHYRSNAAVYESIDDAIIDYRLWQDYIFSCYGTPKNKKQYLAVIERAGYNPNKEYHVELASITVNYKDFLKKFGKFYKKYYDAL